MVPAVPPPVYPVDLGGASSLTRSAEELAAEDERIEELCKRIRKDYETRCDELRGQWPQQRVELVKRRIKFLRRCQRTPGTKRRGLGDCVYLMWCPSLDAYKIGHTDCLWRRTDEHRRVLDPQIEHRVIYYTPLSRRSLEGFLLRHFRHFRVRVDLSEELFDLPQMEANGFEDMAKETERHLLAIEMLRLKARLSQLEAELHDVE